MFLWSCVPLSPAQLGPLGHFHRHRWRQPGKTHRKNWGKPQIWWNKNIGKWTYHGCLGSQICTKNDFWGGPQVSENWTSARRNEFVSKWIMSHKTAMQKCAKIRGMRKVPIHDSPPIECVCVKISGQCKLLVLGNFEEQSIHFTQAGHISKYWDTDDPTSLLKRWAKTIDNLFQLAGWKKSGNPHVPR